MLGQLSNTQGKSRPPGQSREAKSAQSLPELAQDSWCSNPLGFLQKSQNAGDSWPKMYTQGKSGEICTSADKWAEFFTETKTTLVFCWYSFLDLLEKRFSNYELFSQRTGETNDKHWGNHWAWYKSRQSYFSIFFSSHNISIGDNVEVEIMSKKG